MYLPHCLYTSIHTNNHVGLLIRSKKFFSVLQKTNRLLLFIRVYNENWYVAHHLIYQMKIGVRSADSRKWTDRRFETVSRGRKNPSLSSALRNSLSAMSPLRCSLSLSRRKISRKISGTRIAVNHFADDMKFIEQVVHTDGQGHSPGRFRGRLCSSLTTCRTAKVALRALQTIVHVDGQDHSHRRLRGRLCVSH